MTEYYPPLEIAPIRGLTRPLIRPFNISPDCVMALLPEINTKWIDYSNKTNNAVLTGATLKQDGRFGPAVDFDGTNDRVFMPDHVLLRFTTPFSIMIWARRNGTSSDTYGTLIDKGNAAATRNYQMYWSDAANISFKVRDVTNGVDRVTTGALAAETGVWRQIIGVFDGTNITIYIDTVASTPTAVVGTIYTGGQTIYLGQLKYAAGNNYHFNGTMDEVLIFNRELKLWEIQALYERGKPA